MRLNTLRLQNFKGAEDFTFAPQGHNAVVLGRNATGKSTLLDAYCWLLFNRDSRGSASFEPRPLIEGEPLHKMEYAVEAEFQLDEDSTITLKRVLTEKWPRKKGRAFAEFAGVESAYYVNDVPKKVSEFQQIVADLFGDAQMLSDPLYFAGSMPWQERRNRLLALAPDVLDEEVIKSNDDLSGLPELLNGGSVDDLREATKVRRTDLRRKLDQIPAQIREAGRHADPAAPTVKQAEAELARLRQEAEAENAAKEAAKTAERQAFDAVQEARIAHAKAQGEANAKVSRLRAEIETELRSLRGQQRTLIARGEKVKDSGECPECGQPIDAKHAKTEKKRLRSEYDDLTKQVKALEARLAEVEQPEAPDDSALKAAEAAHREAVAALNATRVADMSGAIEAAAAALNTAKAAEAAKARVKELRDEERRVADDFETAEHVLWLCDEFTRTKVHMVEEGINSLFRIVRWKLFEVQNNGGIKEIADATVGGIPWGNLNTGGRMKAGLDIISVLAEQDQQSIPVWLDNAEALTDTLPIDSQIIQLRADEDEPVLRVVLEQARERKAA